MSFNNRSPQITALAPKDDLKPDSGSAFWVYSKHLDKAFQNSKIRNLALSGSLGSGKSSIIRSFDRTRNGEKKHFLYISLMDFSEATTDDGDKQYNQRELEYSLLNQILSHCTSHDLPEGSFAGVPEKYPWLRLRSFLLSFLSFVIFMLFFHDRFGALAGKLGFSENVRTWIHLILYAFVGITLAIGAYFVFRRCLPFFRFSKLTLKSNVAEAEVSLGKERTTLDAYKFELAYILERIGKKHDYTVVFEDLERLDPGIAVDIMGKLRELNILTNNHLQAVYDRSENLFTRKKRAAFQPIRFVYAIGDSTMPVEYRTKFYDCIIPVVPVSHPLNSKEQLKEMLSEFNFGSDWEAKLCDALSDAFVDYRTRLSLRNEFSVLWWLCYEPLPKESIKYPSAPCNNATMFALTAYKVLLPEVFEQVLAPQGIKILPDFTSADDQEKLTKYFSQEKREKAFNAVQKLFASSLLDKTSLRLIVGDQELVEQWMNIIRTALDQDDFDKNDEDRIKKVTEALADAFKNTEADPAQKPYADFRKTMTDRLHKLTSKDKEDQFILVASSLAAVSRESETEDWKWLTYISDGKETQKQYFSRCISFLCNEDIRDLDILCDLLPSWFYQLIVSTSSGDMSDSESKWNDDKYSIVQKFAPDKSSIKASYQNQVKVAGRPVKDFLDPVSH